MTTLTLRSSEGKWVMAAAILASAMAFIDATALNVILPALQKDLKASGADVFWILNAYLLTLAALILVGGSMGDHLGRKKVFMWGIIIFAASSLGCGVAPDVVFLAAARAVQGIGGALMIPGSLSLISSSIAEKERGKAIGTWSAVTTVVTTGGPALGGALADAGLWRYIFFINIPLGLAAVLILLFKVKESRDESGPATLDIPGALSIAGGLALVTYGSLKMPEAGLGSPAVFLSLGFGLLLLLIFVIIEKRSAHPMMPLQLFRNRIFTGTNLLTFFLYAGLGAGMLFMSLNMIQIQGYSQLQSGLTFLPFTIFIITLARFAGGLADRYGPRWLLIAGPSIAGVGLLVLSLIGQTRGPSDYWTTFLPGMVIFGLGMAFTVVPLTAAVMGAAEARFAGTASGINNALTRIAGVFANAIFGALAVILFTTALLKETSLIPLDPPARAAVVKQALELGNARPPANLTPELKMIVSKAYHQSFISAYRSIMRSAALLAFLGAAMAFVFIRQTIPLKRRDAEK